MVVLYIKRKLTHVSDTLNAFAGAMSVMGQAEPVVYNIKGLPYCLYFQEEAANGEIQRIPRSAEQALFAALLWQRSGPDEDIRMHNFPSWTWAEWGSSTRVAFGHLTYAFTIHEPTLRNVQFEGQDRDVLTAKPLSEIDIRRILKNTGHGHCTSFRRSDPTTHALHAQATQVCRWHGYLGPELQSRWWPNVATPATYFRRHGRRHREHEQWCWSLLLSGKHGTPKNHTRFVWVVQWKDGNTAERLGLVPITSSDEEDRTLGDLEEGLEWRRVGLFDELNFDHQSVE
jgi:hypothetical protein